MSAARLGRVGVLTAARLAAALLSAVWFIVAVRHLDVAEVGDLGIMLTLGLLASVGAEFGLTTSLTATVAESPGASRSLVAGVIRRRTSLAFVAALLTVPAFLLAADDPDVRVPLVFAASIVASPVYGTVHACHRALGTVRWETAAEPASRVLALLLGVLLLPGGGVLVAVGIYAGVDVLTSTAHLVALRRLRSDERAPCAVTSGTIGVGTLMLALLQRADVWLVSLVLGGAPVGQYVAVRRISEGLLIPAQTTATLAVGAVASAPAARRRNVQVHHIALASAAGAVAVLPVLVAPGPIIEVLLGEQYSSGTAALRLAALACIPLGVVAVAVPPVLLWDAGRGAQRTAAALASVVAGVVAGALIGGDATAAALGLLLGAIGAAVVVAGVGPPSVPAEQPSVEDEASLEEYLGIELGSHG